ncbi:4'-phosphopantetheinyl transferase family protein [Enterococcus sp. BWR-S5]|uniref:4'-phosphopantetheinyl transferase family protein n=1 Tax=Enterococcus sp. BWR-S5 TaxID=2787714 RepID=UPI001921B2F3|nr:4'-phosphopantetheinyl transferase superfamily protein [Enterococcus sp. BWR-S5]MBL1224604.1 4'-phosphopantetheinyl transferase superfamily protein [Enterococcus sp. BWR-S5]
MIQLYTIDLKDFAATINYADYYPLLEQERLLRIQHLQFEKDRIVCAVSGLLLQYVARCCYQMNKKEAILINNAQGKPQFLDAPFHFNISHSGDWLLCAWSDTPIGIDVEKTEIIFDYLDIAKHFFHPEEHRKIQDLRKHKQLPYFYKIWTAKESYVKYLGKGLSCPLSSFSIEEKNEGLSLSDNSADCFFYSDWLDAKHPYTICTQENTDLPFARNHLSSAVFFSGLDELLMNEFPLVNRKKRGFV